MKIKTGHIRFLEPLRNALAYGCTLIVATTLQAEIPAALTDTIRKGSGTINLLNDMTAAELQNYLLSGTMFLGVDINENASGVESSTSAGIAIKQLELILQTSNGIMTFDNFYTNTTAMIIEEGTSEAQNFYTAFGRTGSNNINGSTSGFDISTFDDVVKIQNIDLEGVTIQGAQLNMAFLETANNAGVNESFFDFSGGFEDFAVVMESDANLLEDYSSETLTSSSQEIVAATTQSYIVNAPAATPEPHWSALLLVSIFVALQRMRRQNPNNPLDPDKLKPPIRDYENRST